MSTKRLWLFCEGLHNRAGIERMTVELANLLCGDYEVKIVVIDPFDYESCPYTIDRRVKVESLNASFCKQLLSIAGLNIPLVKLLRNLIKIEKPDVIISVATPMARIVAPAIVGKKIRHITWEHFNINAGSRVGAVYKALIPWLVDATVVLTQADAEAFRRMKSPRIKVIPNFTSIGENKPSRCDSQTVIAVGRHAPQKGFDMLIRAWAKTDAPGWTLKIVGSGVDREANEALAREMNLGDRIEFKDATPQIAEEFRQASCFVLSSRFEGLVLVLIEAKMMGLPSICFDCPNSPREVVRDGVDGVLVAPEDIDALAQAMSKQLADPVRLKKMGSEARLDAQQRYSPKAIKQTWIQLIENQKCDDKNSTASSCRSR